MRVNYTKITESLLRTSRFLEGYYHRYKIPTGGDKWVYEIRVKDNSQPIDNPTQKRDFYKWVNGVFCYRWNYGYYEYINGVYIWIFIEYRWSPKQ